MFSIKKVGVFLLLLLSTIATCFIFTGCESDSNCRTGYKHHFDSGNRCLYCDKSYCEVKGHSFNDNDFCQVCGATESTNGCKKEQKDTPVGGVLAFGIGLLIVGLISHFIGIQISSPFLMRAPIVVFFFTTIAIFFQFGVLSGIIMLICLIIYSVISVGMNKKYLDYDDIF